MTAPLDDRGDVIWLDDKLSCTPKIFCKKMALVLMDPFPGYSYARGAQAETLSRCAHSD
ncbi:hypothetical protein SAMN05444172_8838 [Burkholderia sp. GAS332]|nr:hypothetical protein SAMN05444172_8838 [Burkholderia sp. GAS332]